MSILQRRNAEPFAVDLREVGVAAEAGGGGYVYDLGGGAVEQGPRVAEAEVAVEVGGRLAGVLAEEAVELSPGQADLGG